MYMFDSIKEYIKKYTQVKEKENDDNILNDDYLNNKKVFESTGDKLNDFNNFCKLKDIRNVNIYSAIQFTKFLYTIYENKKIPGKDNLEDFVCYISSFIKEKKFDIMSNRLDNTTLNDCINLLINKNDFIKIEILKNDVFLSKTLFRSSKIKYLSEGANGSVDKIETYEGNDFIQKSMLNNNSDYINNELVREFIVGLSLLLSVRDKIPNFTIPYGIYSSNGSLFYPKNSETYKNENIESILKESHNIYTYVKNDEEENKYIANLDSYNYKYFLITDYSKGKSLTKELLNIDDKILLSILFQLIRALIYANRETGFVHNDLHSTNIMITEFSDKIILNDVFNEISNYNCHETNHLVKIIDYGYSSITNYVNYDYHIMSNENTTIHNDIIKITLDCFFVLYDEYIIVPNERLFMNMCLITKFILSCYFRELDLLSLEELLQNKEDSLKIFNKIKNIELKESKRAYDPSTMYCKINMLEECKNINPIDIYKNMIELYDDYNSKYNWNIFNNNCNVKYYYESDDKIYDFINEKIESNKIYEIETKLNTLVDNIVNDDIFTFIEVVNSYICLFREFTLNAINNNLSIDTDIWIKNNSYIYSLIYDLALKYKDDNNIFNILENFIILFEN